MRSEPRIKREAPVEEQSREPCDPEVDGPEPDAWRTEVSKLLLYLVDIRGWTHDGLKRHGIDMAPIVDAGKGE